MSERPKPPSGKAASKRPTPPADVTKPSRTARGKGPLLELLERLLATPLAASPRSGKTGPLKALTLDEDGVVLHAALPGWLPIDRETYPLRLRIESTNEKETVFRLELPDTPGLGKMLGWGMGKLPDNLLNDLVGNLFHQPNPTKPSFKNALSKRGDSFVLDHAILLRSMG